MIATAWTFALLLLEAPAAEECALTDNRCRAGMYERRAAKAPSAGQRALFLYTAYRSYFFLFEKTGDARDLCAARRALDASLAVEGQPPSLRAKSETARTELLAREDQQDAHCGSVSRRRRARPADAPLVARGSQLPAGPPPDEPTPPLLAKPEPSAASEAGARTSALQLLADADTASTQPAEVTLLPVEARQVDIPRAPRPGQGLVIAGGVTLGVGAALAAGAGLAGRRMSDTSREIIALSERVDGYATADQAARDAGLRSDYEAQRHQRLALALGSGATIVVAMILAGVGGRRMARAASQSAFLPAPGGLVFRFRF